MLLKYPLIQPLFAGLQQGQTKNVANKGYLFIHLLHHPQLSRHPSLMPLAGSEVSGSCCAARDIGVQSLFASGFSSLPVQKKIPSPPVLKLVVSESVTLLEMAVQILLNVCAQRILCPNYKIINGLYNTSSLSMVGKRLRSRY